MRLRVACLVGVLGAACSVGEIGVGGPAPGIDAATSDAGGTGGAGDGGAGGAGGDLAMDGKPPPLTVGRCVPSGRTRLWIEEGEDLVTAVTCEPVLEPHVTLGASSLPRGASWDPATRELRWTPALDQAGIYRIVLSTEGGEVGALEIGVADDFYHPDSPPLQHPQAYHEETGLPVFHLRLSEQVNDDDYTPAAVTYRGHAYDAEAKYRGRSSREYPKRSYTLKFPKADKFHEPTFAGGFLAKRKLVLIANFDDNSHLRQRLAFELWNRIGPGKIKIQSYSAVVYVNERYAGLYTVTDLIDGNLMEAHGLHPGGNLYKAITTDANFFPNDPLSFHYEKQEGLPLADEPGAFDDLAALGAFFMDAPDEIFRSRLPELIDLGDYRAWLILVTALQAQDTLGKNTYHYRDPQGGRWRTVPWDFNWAFGQTWNTIRETPTVGVGDQVDYNRALQRLYRDAAVGPETVSRYRIALATEIPLATVMGLLETMDREVAAAARRDERRWQQRHIEFERWYTRTDFTDYHGEIAYLRQWIPQRWANLERELATAAAAWATAAAVTN